MTWPSIRDFSNALLNPDVCFNDPELAEGQVELHPRMRTPRTPLVWPGNFASVYKITAADRQNFAVRCFTREVRDHEIRYNRLSQYLKTANPPGFVKFDYQPKGIRVGADWYPIVKMEWVNGQTLDKFVENNLPNPSALKRISDQWREIAGELQRLPAAHNDLQHGNIIIQPDKSIRLVDYDGIFLPQFQGNASPEIGHSNFQHPQRSSSDYAAHIDNFPALVIYLSLLAVAADPGLWRKHYNDDNLIFTKNDFSQPKSSDLFQTLKSNGDATIRNLAALLESYCARPVAETPTLEIALQSNGATPRKTPTSPTTYRQLLQERQQESKLKIDAQDLIRFCIRLDGQELRTLRNLAPFRISVNQTASSLHFTPASSRQTRTCPLAEVRRFLDQFEATKSWSTRDYLPSVTNNASYLLVVLDYYIRFAAQFQSIQDELQAVRQQADANYTSVPSTQDIPDESWDDEFWDDELWAVQQQTVADKAEADKKLRAAQDELQSAQQQAADAKAKLQSTQAELHTAQQQTTVTKQELQTAQSELQVIRQHTAEVEQKLQTAQVELQATQQQAMLDKAEANKQLQTERGARLKAESDTAEANIQLRAEQAARSQAEADKAAADQKLQETQAELQAIRDAPAKKKVSLFDLRLKRRK